MKEEGIPSACESDYNALLSMIVVMAVAGNAPHMANTHPALSYEIPQDVPNTGNLIKLYHAVPTRYMKGRGGQPPPLACTALPRTAGAPPCATTTTRTLARR